MKHEKQGEPPPFILGSVTMENMNFALNIAKLFELAKNGGFGENSSERIPKNSLNTNPQSSNAQDSTSQNSTYQNSTLQNTNSQLQSHAKYQETLGLEVLIDDDFKKGRRNRTTFTTFQLQCVQKYSNHSLNSVILVDFQKNIKKIKTGQISALETNFPPHCTRTREKLF